MPIPLVVANWKMHTTVAQAQELVAELRHALAGIEGVERVLCPPFVSLPAVHEALRGYPIAVGAQNMHWEDQGAFTGEVSPLMLRDYCTFVILGHSERRHLFGESDEMVQRKVRAAFRHGLRPILCVGETLEERRAGRAEAVVRRQLEAALAGVDDPRGLVVAYEPVWAIGTGVPATPETAGEMMGEVVLRTLAALFGEHRALEVPLLYGGSVNAQNIGGFVREPAVHGALVGGASLKPREFVEIVRLTAEAKAER